MNAPTGTRRDAAIPRPAVETRRILPYPNGWFALCFSHELKAGAVRIVPFMGGELVLYRTRAGLARLADPYCPHLGAHLGHGGKVDGEHLVCPYHGLKYGPDGRCARPDGEPRFRVPTLRLWHTREVNGMVFVWRHPDGRAPDWELPELDLARFSRPSFNTLEVDGYAQDGAENGADWLHLSHIHGFRDVRSTPLRIDGPRLSNDVTQFIGRQSFHYSVAWYGIGYATTAITFAGLGLEVNTQAMFTQTAPLHWTLRARHVFRIAHCDRWPAGLRRALYALVGAIFSAWFHRENKKDFIIWNNKSFNERPRLVPGDGPIMTYRRWAAQFYLDDVPPGEPAAPRAPAPNGARAARQRLPA